MVLYIDEIFKRAPKPPLHPVLEEEEEEEDEEMSWIFLFVDLVYVALLSKLSHVLTGCALSVHSFVFVITIFTVSFVTRLTVDDYACRFVTNDLVHRIAYFIYTMCNFIMTLNINSVMPDEDEVPSDGVCGANIYSFGYSCGFLIARLVIVGLLIAVIYEDQRHRDDGDDEKRVHVGGNFLTIADQISRMRRDLPNKVFIFGLFWGRSSPEEAKKLKFNSAFKQFAGTIFKLCLSSFIVIMLLSFEYADGPSKEGSKYYPRAEKIYIFVVAMIIEFGGHLFYYLVFDFNKLHMKRDAKKQILKEKEQHEYALAHNNHPDILQSVHSAKGTIVHKLTEFNRLKDSTTHIQDQNDLKEKIEEKALLQRESVQLSSGKRYSVTCDPTLLQTISDIKSQAKSDTSACCGCQLSEGEELVDDDYYALRVVQYQERLGAFLMLVLGEAIIVLLYPYYESKNARSAYFFSICSCWLLFLFGIQYYDAQNFKNETIEAEEEEDADKKNDEPHDEEHHRHQHAMNHSALSRFLYVWLHLALAICVFFTSSSMGALYESAMHQIASDDGDDANAYTPKPTQKPTPKPTYAPTHAPTLKLVLGLRASFDSAHLRGLAGPAPVPAGASAGTSAAVKTQYDDDGSNDDVSDDTWDHRPLVSMPVLFSTSVALFIIIVTVVRSLHTGLEDLFSLTPRPTKHGETPKSGFSRLTNKLIKMGWALLHLTVGFWKMSTPARYVGAHCALLSALTFFEVILRFKKKSHIVKVKGHGHSKTHALLKVTVGTDETGHVKLFIHSAGHTQILNLERLEHERHSNSSSALMQRALESGPRLSIGDTTRSRKVSSPVGVGSNPMHL